jgi:hypothetical protein
MPPASIDYDVAVPVAKGLNHRGTEGHRVGNHESRESHEWIEGGMRFAVYTSIALATLGVAGTTAAFLASLQPSPVPKFVLFALESCTGLTGVAAALALFLLYSASSRPTGREWFVLQAFPWALFCASFAMLMLA